MNVRPLNNWIQDYQYCTNIVFFVVDAKPGYIILLGREWIHANHCVPSTLYQQLQFWNGDKIKVVSADSHPFHFSCKKFLRILFTGNSCEFCCKFPISSKLVDILLWISKYAAKFASNFPSIRQESFSCEIFMRFILQVIFLQIIS